MGYGGAISIVEPHQVYITGAWFASNTAIRGGAIYTISATHSGDTMFHDCSFYSNTATDGGAIYLDAEAGPVIFSGSSFEHNSASKNAQLL